MRKFKARLTDKAIDRGLEYLLVAVSTGLSWLFLSPFYGGWVAVVIAIFVAFVAVCAIILAKRWTTGRYTPPEGRKCFVGYWRCGHGDPALGTFIMTLNEDGSVRKSHVPEVSGTWQYCNGAARINTTDQWRDIVRYTPEGVIKFAYSEHDGPRPDSSPDNVSTAEKVSAPDIGQKC